MSEANRYDVIIIGTGGGGGALAWKLAPSGKSKGRYAAKEMP